MQLADKKQNRFYVPACTLKEALLRSLVGDQPGSHMTLTGPGVEEAAERGLWPGR